MIATLGETTGYSALKYIRAQMEQSEEGADILRYITNWFLRSGKK